MNTPGQSVFISYAREDLAAARRIADALKAFEVEVWFDEAGLEGGDAWDQKIRRQIKECSLFIPIISAQTQARREAYFRLEWKLAEERTHLMAEGTSFLLPIAIDDTPEDGALVPESFRRTQWTRLARGVPNTPFVDRVRALLEQQRTHGLPPVAAGVAPPARTRKKLLPVAVFLALAVGASILFWLPRKPTAPAPATADKSALADKSIAVLPFDNLSDDKDNAFFADGMHEEILTNLTNVGDLRVVSRTSVMQYRGGTKAKDVRQIASELGVAYILEGSVQRSGNTVRVHGQLIDARTDAHLWARNFDGDISDVFALQTRLATEIANSLQAVLTPRDQARLQRTPTTSSAAYDLYLKAVEIRNGERQSLDGLNREAPLLESAVDLDPRFAAAWGELALVHVGILRWSYDPTGSHLEKARQAAETMERLAPDEPDTWIRLAKYYAAVVDYVRAEDYIRRAAQAQPNNSWVVVQLGNVARWHGRAAEALSLYRRAFELDRQNPEARGSLASWLRDLRRYDEAVALEQNYPDPRDNGYTLASLAFYARGSTREMETWLAAHPSASRGSRMTWKFNTGDAAGLIQLVNEARHDLPTGYFFSLWEVRYGMALMALGQTDEARKVWTENLVRWRKGRQPDSAGESVTLAFLGEKQAALAAFAEFRARREKQGVNPDFVLDGQARLAIFIRVGEREQALAELARLLKIPGLNVHVLRRELSFVPLQGDPRFEAILNDPANNAPLL